MISFPEYIFVTGVPGSKWTGVSETLEATGHFNITDRRDYRSFYHNGGLRHLGNFFGRRMEYEAVLEKQNLDAPFTDNSGSKLIKSHDWAYNLENIQSVFPTSWILLIYRPNLESFHWWCQAGGFDIRYPDYSVYKDANTMMYEIAEQNKNILKFARSKSAVWYHNSKEFYKKIFDLDINVENRMDDDNILLTVIK
jgi:hypothetical protein